MNPCMIDQCPNPCPNKTKPGVCNTHAQRMARGGTYELRRTANGESLRWLQSVIDAKPTDECIEWPFGNKARSPGRHLTSGYGLVNYTKDDGRVGTRMATHVLLEMAGFPQPEPPRNKVLHACDNPPCCNPRHLRWGSTAENGADHAARGGAYVRELERLALPQLDQLPDWAQARLLRRASRSAQ